MRDIQPPVGAIRRGFYAGIYAAGRLPAAGRVVGWLFLFIIAYRLGLPVLYAAALAALPWLLLPATKTEKP